MKDELINDKQASIDKIKTWQAEIDKKNSEIWLLKARIKKAEQFNVWVDETIAKMKE